MRVVFLLQASSLFTKGGTELQADMIMSEMLKYGHEVYCVSDLMGKPGPGLPGVEYRYLKSWGRRLSLLNFFRLNREMKDIDPDIIYQRYRVPYTGMAAWYSNRHSSKMVFGLANVRDPKKNKVPLNKMFAFNFMSERIGRYGVKNCDAIVAQTYEQKDILRRNFNRECVVIRNGHPVPQPPFEKSAPPVVIWVSNVKHIKRLELFFDLAEKLQNTVARFVYVGRLGNNPYQMSLAKRAEGLKNVRHMGELSYDEANVMIAKASVLVNTSASEGFPNTFIQAWLRETPVVSLAADPDRILQNEGIGYCSGNFEKFVEDVRCLIEDEDKRMRMGKNARQYAVKNHDIEKTGKSYRNLFEHLIEKD